MKCYVLDTNVLIQTPASMDVFEENQIVIPLVVVEELDRLKTAEGLLMFSFRLSFLIIWQITGFCKYASD